MGVVATGVVSVLATRTASARRLFVTPQSEPEEMSTGPVEVDISKLEPGQLITVTWQGKPVWIVHRTETNLNDLPTLNEFLTDPHSIVDRQPEYARNSLRSIRPDIAVLVGICTHLGCTPGYRPDIAPEDIGPYWKGGFLCPCHGSRYDLAGRVFMGSPAPENLEVPLYRYSHDSQIVVGEDSDT